MTENLVNRQNSEPLDGAFDVEMNDVSELQNDYFAQYASKGVQTDSQHKSMTTGKMKVFMCSIIGSDASTQVEHDKQETKVTLAV